MNAGWIIPFIILGGALQSCGAAMNGQLNKSMVNPWLASAVSFALITFFFIGALPDHASSSTHNEGASRHVLVGSHRRIGWSGPGLRRADPRQQSWSGTLCRIHGDAALIMSLAIDHFGWLRMDHHPLNTWRAIGGLLLVGGVALIARF